MKATRLTGSVQDAVVLRTRDRGGPPDLRDGRSSQGLVSAGKRGGHSRRPVETRERLSHPSLRTDPPFDNLATC